MLDSSNCMLVRSEVTQPWRAVDALESILIVLVLCELTIYPARVTIAPGASISLSSIV